MKKLLFTLCLLASSAHAAIAHVAGSDGSGSGSAAAGLLTITLGSAATSGDLIVCGAGSFGQTGAGVSSVTDSKGQSYTKVVNTVNIGTTTHTQIWFFPNSVSGVTTVTINTLLTTGNIFGGCARFTGAASSNVVDGNGVTNTGTSSIPTGASFTPSVANELLISVEVDTSAASNTAGGSAALFYGLAIGADGEWQVLVGSPSTTMSFGGSKASWAMITAGFEPPAAATCNHTLALLGAGCS